MAPMPTPAALLCPTGRSSAVALSAIHLASIQAIYSSYLVLFVLFAIKKYGGGKGGGGGTGGGKPANGKLKAA